MILYLGRLFTCSSRKIEQNMVKVTPEHQLRAKTSITSCEYYIDPGAAGNRYIMRGDQ